MLLRLNANLKIDNCQCYPPESVERLRALLVAGTHGNPDPHREHVYEVESGPSIYYIYVSPVSQDVTLLAIWQKQAAIAAC